MPIKKQCSHPACRTLLDLNQGARCDKHQKKPKQSVHKEPQRSSAPEIVKFYNSRAWRLLSKRFLQQNPLCKHCLEQGIVTPAVHTDHIEEVKDSWEKRLDVKNLQALCQSCHNRKTWQEKNKREGKSKEVQNILDQIRNRSDGVPK